MRGRQIRAGVRLARERFLRAKLKKCRQVVMAAERRVRGLDRTRLPGPLGMLGERIVASPPIGETTAARYCARSQTGARQHGGTVRFDVAHDCVAQRELVLARAAHGGI